MPCQFPLGQNQKLKKSYLMDHVGTVFLTTVSKRMSKQSLEDKSEKTFKSLGETTTTTEKNLSGTKICSTPSADEAHVIYRSKL